MKLGTSESNLKKEKKVDEEKISIYLKTLLPRSL